MDEIYRRVKTPADLRNLPGYTDQVDPRVSKLKRVIWPYHFRFDTACSLTNCHAKHKDGVIIELDDGRVSNIGHICGADPDKFSDDFIRLRAEMSDARQREQMLPALLNRKELEKTRGMAVAARGQALPWAERRDKFSELFPTVAREITRRMQTANGLLVYEAKERTESEIDDMIASGKATNRAQARNYETLQGAIQGTSIFSLSSAQLEKLCRQADALCAADPQAADMMALHELYRDLLNIPVDAEAVLKATASAKEFFSAKNLRLLTFLSMPPNERTRLDELTLAKLDAQMTASRAKQLQHREPTSKRQRDIYRRAGLPVPMYRDEIK